MTADPADLLTIAAECEAATGPDRELDVRIALAVGANFAIGPWVGVDTYEAVAGSYTASVDAAFSLLQEALPGWPV